MALSEEFIKISIELKFTEKRLGTNLSGPKIEGHSSLLREHPLLASGSTTLAE